MCFVFLCASSHHTSYPALLPVGIIKHSSSLIQSSMYPRSPHSVIPPLLFSVFHLSSLIPIRPPLPAIILLRFVCQFFSSVAPPHCSISPYYPPHLFNTLSPFPSSLSLTLLLFYEDMHLRESLSLTFYASPPLPRRYHLPHPPTHITHTCFIEKAPRGQQWLRTSSLRWFMYKSHICLHGSICFRGEF